MTNTFTNKVRPLLDADVEKMDDPSPSTQERSVNASTAEPNEFAHSNEVTSWSDAQLISSVRCDPPDEAALDVLVTRYWQFLFGRCQMLTLSRERARDLAQAAWCRLLRTRHALKPDGDFPSYVATIATNLFRDSYRSARRAGPMADHQLVSLDVALTNDEGEAVFLESVLPDLNALRAEEQARLRIDIDEALTRLAPLLREVLVARFIAGESCAEIGLHHGRTEQTVSGWVREAIRQMKAHLEDADRTMNINVRGVLYGMKHEIPAILKSGGGAIVNNASALGLSVVPNAAVYNASKFAVIGLTKTAALEFSAKGVRVNAVCPAVVETDINASLRADAQGHATLLAMHPIGRFGKPEEIAAVVLFLCSPGAGFTTGIAMPVDGGWTAQ